MARSGDSDPSSKDAPKDDAPTAVKRRIKARETRTDDAVSFAEGEGGGAPAESRVRVAKYALGDIVRHRVYPFRGVIYDVDPVFANTEEWYQSIPAQVRPRKDQPFYHLLARNQESTYQAYVSEQNLLPDADGGPVAHPLIDDMFDGMRDGRYRPRARVRM